MTQHHFKSFSKPFNYIICMLFGLMLSFGSIASPSISVEINPDPIEPGEMFDVQISIGNIANTNSGSMAVRLIWPDNVGSSPTVTRGGECIGSCGAGETLLWDTSDIGIMSANEVIVVSVNTYVRSSVLTGTVVPFMFELLQDGAIIQSLDKSLVVDATSDLDLSVDPVTSPISQGENLRYHLTYGNHSDSNASNVFLRFPIPTGTSFVSATNGGTEDNGIVTWSLGNLPAKRSAKQEVTLIVDTGLTNGYFITVQSAVLEGTINFLGQSTRAMANNHVEPQGSLLLSMEINPDPVSASETVDIQLKITNIGNNVESLSELRLLWPNRFEDSPYMTDGGSCIGNCSAGEYISWDNVNLGVLPPGKSISVSVNDNIAYNTFSGRVIQFEAELLQNQQLIKTISHSIVVDSNNSLDLSVDPLSDPISQGKNLVYQLTYGNHGDSNASDALIKFPVPSGTSFVSASGGGDLDGDFVVWDIGNIPATKTGKNTVIFSINANLADGTQIVADTVKLEAIIDFLYQSTSSMATSIVKVSEPIKLTFEVNPDPVMTEETIDMQLKITNTSNSLQDLSTLRLFWPKYMENTQYITGGGDCAGTCYGGNHILWDTNDLGVLPPGGSTVVSVNERVISGIESGRVLQFEAELIQDGNLISSVSHSVVVNLLSNLDLVIDPSLDPIVQGNNLIYNLTYGNHGESNAADVVLTFPIPKGSSFVSATGGGVQVDNSVIWSLSDIFPHTGGRQQVILLVDGNLSDGEQLIVDSASLSGMINFITQTTNAMATSEVNSQNQLSLMMNLIPDPAESNEIVDVLMNITNTENTLSDLISMRLLWPNYMNYSPAISNSGSCSGTCYPGNYLNWSDVNLGILPPAGGFDVSASEDIYSSTLHGRVIPFEAEVYEDGFYVRSISQSLVVQDFTDNDGDGEADIYDQDDDNDGMPDWWENQYGFNPFDEIDATYDPDNDFINNLDEFLAGTNPLVSDIPDLIFENGFE